MRSGDAVCGKLLSDIELENWISADHPLRVIRGIVNTGEFGEPAASDLSPPGGALRRRSRGFEARNLLFLTVVGIVGAASAGSLFTAAFVLLMEPKAAMRPAALSAVRAQPAPAAGAANTLSLASPATSLPSAQPVPAASAAKSVSLASPAASLPSDAAQPRIAPVPASRSASPPPATVRPSGDRRIRSIISRYRYHITRRSCAGEAGCRR
jgi:hypothetical protein